MKVFPRGLNLDLGQMHLFLECGTAKFVSMLEGIRGAGYAMFPCMQGGLETQFMCSPLPSTDACSPRLPAALFLKALQQDLRLVDKH